MVEDDKLSWLVVKDDGRNGASLKYREQSPSVATVTISNSPAFHLFFIGEKFVDLAVRNARNTLEEARKWGRVDDGGGGGGGGGAGGGGVRDVRVVRANATVVRVARPEWDESDGEQVISREMCIGRIWPRDSFFFLSFFLPPPPHLSLSLLFLSPLASCPSKPKLLHVTEFSPRVSSILSRKHNDRSHVERRVLSSSNTHEYFTVTEGIFNHRREEATRGWDACPRCHAKLGGPLTSGQRSFLCTRDSSGPLGDLDPRKSLFLSLSLFL